MNELNGRGGSPLMAPLCCKTEAPLLFEVLPFPACARSIWSPSPISVNPETSLESSFFVSTEVKTQHLLSRLPDKMQNAQLHLNVKETINFFFSVSMS